MFVKFIITILLSLPLAKVFAAEAEITTAEKMNDSISLHNHALKHFESNQLGLAKSYAEQSLFINPISIETHRLNTKISEQLTDQLGTQKKESISLSIHILDTIPPLFSYIFLILAFFLFIYALAKLRLYEKSFFKKDPRMRLKAAGAGALFATSLLIYTVKQMSTASQWACVTSVDAPLYTGPDSNDFVQTTSLPQGSCVRVIKNNNDWVSLKPEHHPAGWSKRTNMVIVRSYKFDPIQNKD